MPAISLVIPSFRGQKLLAQNLPAWLRALRSGDQLLIVDDASGETDQTLEFLRKKFILKKQPFSAYAADLYQGVYKHKDKQITVSLLCNRENQRFAVAANRGVELAEQELVLLLNNDVKPYPGAIEKLIYHFHDAKVFAVACLENDPGTGRQSGKNVLYFQRGLFMHRKAEDLKFGPTAWATGGSAMFRKEMWLELGGFDRRYYPAYWEDIDLSFQARKRAWQVLFEPQAVVDHRHETTNDSVFGQRKIRLMSWNNAVKFTQKNANFGQYLSFLFWRPYWWYQTWRLITNKN